MLLFYLNKYLTQVTKVKFLTCVAFQKMSNLRYRKLKQEGEEDEVDGSDFDNSQFEKPKAKVPWKAISYAVILLLIGTILLTIGCLIVTGHIDQEKHNERFWPLILLGALLFIPGIVELINISTVKNQNYLETQKTTKMSRVLFCLLSEFW